MIKAAVVGASGYIGGELIRLLWEHPEAEITALVSRRYEGEKVHRVHPNLRGLNLRFTGPKELDADVIFLSVPHGTSMRIIDDYAGSSKVIDMSADFRVPLELYREYYGEHLRPELLEEFVYGLPELHRDEIRRAELIANPGCNSTAVILALHPFRDLVDEATVDLKVGSSAGGRKGGLPRMHPERSNAVRVYRTHHHRHEAEILNETGVRAHLTVHSVDLVRGLMATMYLRIESDRREIYRRLLGYLKEPFVRIVKDRRGIQRLPDPKYLIGSNFVDIGFECDENNGRVILFSALDNLMKGGAGQAVQNMNLTFSLEETTGLRRLPIYPV